MGQHCNKNLREVNQTLNPKKNITGKDKENGGKYFQTYNSGGIWKKDCAFRTFWSLNRPSEIQRINRDILYTKNVLFVILFCWFILSTKNRDFHLERPTARPCTSSRPAAAAWRSPRTSSNGSAAAAADSAAEIGGPEIRLHECLIVNCIRVIQWIFTH